MQIVEASVIGNGTFRTLLTGLFGPKRFFVLLTTYWIGFISDFGLYKRQTSQQGTILVPGLVAPKPSRTWTSRPIFSSGSSRTTFRVGGARWLSGRVSDSGARGPGFETYRRRVVSLSKTLYSPKVLVNYPGSDGSVPIWLKNCWLGR